MPAIRERKKRPSNTVVVGGRWVAVFDRIVRCVVHIYLAMLTDSLPREHARLTAAAVITLVGALDDRFDLSPAVKLAGQVLAAVIVVHFGVAVKAITLPFVGKLAFPNAGFSNAGPVLTVVGLVAMMNVVNFSDGVDGLAAGVCVIIAATINIAAGLAN